MRVPPPSPPGLVNPPVLVFLLFCLLSSPFHLVVCIPLSIPSPLQPLSFKTTTTTSSSSSSSSSPPPPVTSLLPYPFPYPYPYTATVGSSLSQLPSHSSTPTSIWTRLRHVHARATSNLDIWTQQQRSRSLSTHMHEISPPVITVPMIAVPPRDLIPGSTKGMPYRVRLVDVHASHRITSRRSLSSSSSSSSPSFLSSMLHTARRRLLSHYGYSSYDISSSSSSLSSSSSPTIYTVDLHGGIVGVGEYFSVIEIANRRIRVQIDTGSSTLAVPMRGCTSCINKANRYSMEDSSQARVIHCDSEECAADRCTSNCPVCSRRGACCSTERPMECGFSLRYADGSAASGSVVRDEMRWGNLKANVTFGGILHNSPNFERPEVDGILGMAFKSLACNPSCFDPPFDTFVKGGLVEDVFSICMTNTGGKLMLGGYDDRVAKSEVEYVGLSHLGAERYYRVALDGKLGIGGESVSMPDFRTAIVDTGTTLIVTSTRTFTAIREELQRRYCDVPELCGADSWFQSGMCVNLADEDLALMPKLTFSLGGSVRLSLAAEDYMLLYRRGRRRYRCVGIMGMDGLGGMVVLGNTLMQRYVTVYDRRRGRIGFALAAKRCGD